MQRFIQLLLRCIGGYQPKEASTESGVSSGNTVGQVVWGLVHSAIFWELSNLRGKQPHSGLPSYSFADFSD